jgi:uncharacterized integral membrane protein
VARDDDAAVQREGKSHVDGRLVVGGIVLVLLVVFIAQNTYETPLNFLFFDFSAPLWLMLAITVVLSLGIGYLLGRRGRRRD